MYFSDSLRDFTFFFSFSFICFIGAGLSYGVNHRKDMDHLDKDTILVLICTVEEGM